jgi:hypothetical protein
MSGDHYRALAHECMQAADRSSDPGRKVSLLELARRWLRLAQQAHERAQWRDALVDVPALASSPRKRCLKPEPPQRFLTAAVEVMGGGYE